MWLPLALTLHAALTVSVVTIVARGRRSIDRRCDWPHSHPEWRIFERQDRPLTLSELLKLVFCAATLLPARLAICLTCFGGYWLALRLLALRVGCSMSRPLPVSVRRAQSCLGRWATSGFLFGMGLWPMRRIGGPPKDLTGVTLLCNHASYVDILVMMAEVMPAFVSKQALGDVLGVGFMAKFAGCIFVRQDVSKGQVWLTRAALPHTVPNVYPVFGLNEAIVS